VLEAETLCSSHYEASSQKVAESARRCLEHFIDEYREERPDFFWGPGDHGLSWRASLHNEVSWMLWATWMVEIGLSASTATTYLSLARTTVELEYGWKTTIRDTQVRLPKLMRSLRKMHRTVRRKRLGWRAHHHRQWRATFDISTASDEVLLADAAMATAREGLARVTELAPARHEDFDEARHPTVQDVTLQQSPQPHIVLWLLPAKKAPGQTQKVPVPLPEASGDVVGAFAGIVRMLRARQAAAGWYGPVFDETGAVAGLSPDAPLFARARTGAPMTKAEMVAAFQRAAEAIGLTGEGGQLVSGHSGRIGGATDHFAKETPPAVLQICGRWDSDLWQIYTRQCIEQTLTYTARASTCDDVAVEELFDDYTQPAVVAAGL